MQIIEAKQFRIVFQPVVKLPEGEIYGYEALVRLPEGSCFASPLQLFNFAAEAGLLYPLERVTREEALRHLGLFSLKHKLFLNINPQIINDPRFIPGQTARFVRQYNLTPENIVFEITEGMAIKDFPAFRKTLDHYRSQGYLIAIDDFGAGYSNLRTVAELQPDFIKLDMSLVHGVHKKTALQALMETLRTFACKIHSQLIAEGIENEAELMKLVQLGIPFGQGYLLAQPAFPPPMLDRKAAEVLQHAGAAQGFGRKMHNKPHGAAAERVSLFLED
ncbi:MAG TPA: EAL domain-containing protein [Syntrophomonadaceae bacterium]|nr:EAL domain-containing protein [Syntrophomonadaceae bacterium]